MCTYQCLGAHCTPSHQPRLPSSQIAASKLPLNNFGGQQKLGPLLQWLLTPPFWVPLWRSILIISHLVFLGSLHQTQGSSESHWASWSCYLYSQIKARGLKPFPLAQAGYPQSQHNPETIENTPVFRSLLALTLSLEWITLTLILLRFEFPPFKWPWMLGYWEFLGACTMLVGWVASACVYSQCCSEPVT